MGLGSAFITITRGSRMNSAQVNNKAVISPLLCHVAFAIIPVPILWMDLFSDSIFFCVIFPFLALVTYCRDDHGFKISLITGDTSTSTFFFFPCLF